MARDPTGTAVYDPENPLTSTRLVRPSPRTGTTGAGIQKFGTQQLKMLDTGGVIEKDVGARTRLAWQEAAGGGGGITTPFSQQYQQERPNTIRTLEQLETSPHAIPEGWLGGDFPSLGDLFGGGAMDKHGCECEACKNGTGQCSDKNPKCNSWDLGCEVTGGITNPIGSWWDKYGNWVYLILGVIGLGVLLWLLRPLFSMIGAFKGGSP